MLKCPKCGGRLVKIVYGLPIVELAEKAEQHECLLGGCVILPDNPGFYCYDCNTAFSRNLKKDYPNYCDIIE